MALKRKTNVYTHTSGRLGMLPTDMALKTDPGKKKIMEKS
jgi:hypothetical protein